MSRFTHVLGDLFEAVGVYLFTFLGIVMSQYAPLLLQKDPIVTSMEWVRLGLSAIMALYIVARDEETGDKAGRRSHIKKRLATAFTHGYAWNGMVGLAVTAAVNGG
jgi:hypothetical protein